MPSYITRVMPVSCHADEPHGLMYHMVSKGMEACKVSYYSTPYSVQL